MAQHYSHVGQHTRAIELLDEALLHTPTLPELYPCKARLLKRAGGPVGAVCAIEEARKLDF